jgi:hypothetical protein
MSLELRAAALGACATFFGIVAAGVGLAGCNFDTSANPAHGCETCAPGMCYLGYCLQPATSAGATGSGGAGEVGVGTIAGQGGDGASGTTVGAMVGASGVGGGSGGMPNGGGPPGSCVPADEMCNGSDDDCDGKLDEDVLLGSCAASGSDCGGVLACEGGAPVCHASDQPAVEICNGVDDDCDGTVDEQSDMNCYPDDTAGCTKKDDGGYDCVGACKHGTRECKDGKLAECVAFVVPVAELCGNADAQDEDCDGAVDDDCPCQATETQSCYTGPALTRGVGTCRAGKQTCMNGLFGPCEGAITPVDETCQNQGANNDCNLFTDDVFGLGFGCTVSRNKGVCRDGYIACGGGQFVCVTPNKAAAETVCDGLDENCNGLVDEVFDLDNDEHNCGSCGTTCANGELCCAGHCVGTNSNDHCGSCTACAAGTGCCNRACLPNGPGKCNACIACDGALTCCDGMCQDTTTNERCGSCDNSCGDSCTCVSGQCQSSEGMACPPPP